MQISTLDAFPDTCALFTRELQTWHLGVFPRQDLFAIGLVVGE